MHRTTAALALAALLVLAGCSTFGGVGTTRQPFGVDDPAGTTNSNDAEESPPVISFNPVQNTTPDPFDLVNAHDRSLEDESFAVEYTHSRTYANGTTVAADEFTSTFAADHSTYAHVRLSTYFDDSVTRKLYANGTHVWALTHRSDDANATPRILRGANDERVLPNQTGVGTSTDVIVSGMLAMEVTNVEKLDAVPSGVDEPVFHVVMNRTKVDDPYGDRTLNASLSLYVTEDGRIIDYEHRYAYVENDQVVHVQTRIQYYSVGTATVDVPDWVPENESRPSPLDPSPPGGQADRTLDPNNSTVETPRRTDVTTDTWPALTVIDVSPETRVRVAVRHDARERRIRSGVV